MPIDEKKMTILLQYFAAYPIFSFYLKWLSSNQQLAENRGAFNQ